MEYSKLEIDLHGLKKEGICYVLDGDSAALAPALAAAGVPFVAMSSPENSNPSVRPCQAGGENAVTNLEVLPKGWEFSDQEASINLGNLIVPVEKNFDMPSENMAEERFVYGEVLIPDHTDSHGHTIKAALVRETSHNYMAKFQEIKVQHERRVTGKVVILESYIAPVDFDLAGNSIKKGTWMMGVRVTDDDLWGKIKSGKLTGFSVGGWGKVSTL